MGRNGRNPPHAATRARRRAWVLAAAVALLPALGAPALAKEQLVPANTAQMNRTDARGLQWDPDPQGVLRDCTNDCFDGAMALKVNGGNFSPTKAALQTKDGHEFVLEGAVGQVRIIRRVRIDPTLAAARYVEVFENTSQRSVNVTAEIYSTLGGNATTVVTNLGRVMLSGALEKGEVAVLAVHTGRSNRPSVLWHLRGLHSRNVPVVNVSNNRNFTFTWSVAIPPGRKAALLHSVAQRRWGGPPGTKELEAELKPLHARAWLKGIPAGLRRVLVNHSAAVGSESLGSPAPAHAELLALAKAYDVERGADAVLLLEPGKPLTGAAAGEIVSVATRRGSVELPLREVAAIHGGANVGRSQRVYLRGGEILAGTVRAEGLRFTTGSGLEFPLDPAGIEVLVLPSGDGDGRVAQGVDAFLTQLDGTKLALDKTTGARIEAVSPWGDLTLALEDVVRMRYTPDPVPGLWILLADGSRFPLAVRGEPLRLTTRRFGPVAVRPGSIAAWRRHGVAAAITRNDDGDEGPATTHARLAGGAYLAGTFASEALHLATTAGATAVEVGQIRKLERGASGPGDTPTFLVTLATGESIEGRLTASVLAFRTPRATLLVPTLHLLGYAWFPVLPAEDGASADGEAKADEGKDDEGKDDEGKDGADVKEAKDGDGGDK